MIGTEARTMDGGTTGTNETRHDASTAAERLDGPLEDEQGRGTATDDQTNADRQVERGVRQRTSLIEPGRAESYNSRWKELKGEFVDDPRRAVQGANELVGEALDELEELFRRQRTDLEQGLDSEQTSTEDLRQALIRHPSFIDRLLSF